MSLSTLSYPESQELSEDMALEEIRREFNERMDRVEDKVDKLTVSMEGLRGNQESRLMLMERITARLDEQVNGDKSSPGLRIEMDRQKQIEKARVWHIRAIWAALLGGGFKAMIDVIFHK